MNDAGETLIKRCPRCGSERRLSELYCQNIVDGAACQFRLLTVAPSEPEAESAPAAMSEPEPASQEREAEGMVCANGHPVDPGDLICPECGLEIDAAPSADVAAADDGELADAPAPEALFVIDGWRASQALSPEGDFPRRYLVEDASRRRGVLTLYDQAGAEPDPEVYDELQRLSLDHMPAIYAVGRHDGAAYDITEHIEGGDLAALEIAPEDVDAVGEVALEVAKALRDFNRLGLRHRDLQPECVLIRKREPLDLVIDGFGSAALSDHDLETVAPLEQTRYMAPEAIAGAVSPASDWWSLGVMLLEILTRGACFEGIGDRAFVIHAMAHGLRPPDDVDPNLAVLLRGLLVRDHAARWQWPEFERWLDGDPPEPTEESQTFEPETGPALELGGAAHRRPGAYALAAARPENWDAAGEQLLRGDLLTWLDDADAPSTMRAAVRALADRELAADVRLSLALKYLNPNMPLVCRGDIVSPGWLMGNAEAARGYLAGDAPDLIAELPRERWLAQLKLRDKAVRERARHHEIDLDEGLMAVLELATNRAGLAAQWAQKRRHYPDSDHAGLAAVMDRRQASEEDLILLLAAEQSQFLGLDEVLAEAERLARNAKVGAIDRATARARVLDLSRVELMRAVDERTADFARCGNAVVDGWVDQFRVQRRMSLPQALATLSIDEDVWKTPKSQAYIQQVISFFEQKITYAITRGPLVRMTIGKTTAKIDLSELHGAARSARSLLDVVLRRNGAAEHVDPEAFVDNPRLANRLWRLQRQSRLFMRDTGINGLYLGFPFIVYSPSGSSAKARIAPILLWPVTLEGAVGRLDGFKLSFDVDRDEVKLNPALEGFLGEETMAAWRAKRDLLLSGALDADSVLAEFGKDFETVSEQICPLPDFEPPRGTGRLAPSAVLFHAAYMAQAIVEDLRRLRNQPPGDTALAALLRIRRDEPSDDPLPAPPERERYFTVASDPSQEAAVLAARERPGLVIEGPPGTGKSQTIVNLVGDAIGRKRSIAIVCQKYAALEVVRKRLAAEGLGDRLILVTDENKDRRAVLEAVREQLARLKETPANPQLTAKRERIAAEIEKLEAELADHHAALHTHDPTAEASYRELLGELIQLDDVVEIELNDFRLQRALGELDRAALETAASHIGDVASDWLASDFEDSPLADLKPFGWDAAAVQGFTLDFDAYMAAETERRRHVEQSPLAFDCPSATELAAWLADAEAEIDGLSDSARHDLKAWRSQLPEVLDVEAACAQAIEAVERQIGLLNAIDVVDDAPRFHSEVQRMSPATLKQWVATAERATREVGFFQRLSFARMGARRRLRRLIAASGGPVDQFLMRDFLAAARIEVRVRPIRRAAIDLAKTIKVARGPDGGPLEAMDAGALRRLLADLNARFMTVRGGVAALSPSPVAAEALDAAEDAAAWTAFKVDCATVGERHSIRAESAKLLERLEMWMTEAWVADRRADIAADRDAHEIAAAIHARYPTVVAFQRFRARAHALPEAAWRPLLLLRDSASLLEQAPSDRLGEQLRLALWRLGRLGWKTRIENQNPALLPSRRELEGKVEALAEADRAMRASNAAFLREGIDRERLAPARNWEAVTRFQGPRALRLREFIRRAADLGLMELRPVWLLNPDVASRVLPLQEGLFDLVIYDEASQMPIEFALPTLYRGRTVVVSGDEKQLPPTSFFHSKVESDEAELLDGDAPDEDLSEAEMDALETEWNRKEVKDCPDLLSLGRTSIKSTMLKIHYRSAFRELIDFSNQAFYRGELSVPARHPDLRIEQEQPLEVRHVNGVYVAQTNPEEAKAVADIVADYWRRDPAERPSIGVVTFNRKQADLIEDVLGERAEADRAFGAALERESARVEDGEDMGFFVKNLENVQGDERDVILFSTTFGLNESGAFRRYFGVLGQSGGERRLNVAVTRARQKVVIATSMPIDEISEMLSGRERPAKPRDFLQCYLHYAALTSAGRLAEARAFLGRMGAPGAEAAAQGDHVLDGFVSTVGDFIRNLGYPVERADDGGAFGLDFAISHPEHGLFGIGVECDAPRHGLLATARAREIWRPSVLRRAIPHIHRVSSQAWREAPDHEKAYLAHAIRAAVGPPPHEREMEPAE